MKTLKRILFTRHHDNGYVSCVEQNGESSFIAACVIPKGAVDASIPPVHCTDLATAMNTADMLAHGSCNRHCGKWKDH